MKHHEKNYLQKIMQEDVDVDVERFGRFIDDTEKVLLNSKNQMFHSAPKVIEVVYDTKGEEIKQQEPSNIDPNVRDDTPPLKWTGKFFPREEIIGKFVFKRSIQLYHNDGLTFEFLYDMAKELNQEKSMVLLGAGLGGKEPLIFQSNGTPYRGFLDGYVEEKKYQLFLRLSNMELKTAKA